MLIQQLHQARSSIQPPEWLIQDLIETGSLTSIIAKPASYKSFFALDIGASIATGSNFHGKRTKKGNVLYLCGEGQRGFHERAEAWERHNGLRITSGFDIMHEAFRLQDKAECFEFMTAVAARSESHKTETGRPNKPDLIIIDTLARYSSGVDENSAQDMGRLLSNIQSMIVEGNGIGVLFIHHSGRAGSHSRGSSAVDGAVDFEFRLEASNKQQRRALTVKSAKAKDHEAFPDLEFALIQVPIREGSSKTSLILELATFEAPKVEHSLPKTQRTLFEALSARSDLETVKQTAIKKSHLDLAGNIGHTAKGLYKKLGGDEEGYSWPRLIKLVAELRDDSQDPLEVEASVFSF